MKKILAVFSFLVMTTSSVWAVNDNSAPPQYMEIVMKCNDVDIFKNNKCLKDELLNIIGKSFKPEQKIDLSSQLDEIEKTIDKSQLNDKNPEIKALGNDPEKIKNEKAQNLNLIWKKLILDTLKMLDESRAVS